MSILDTLQGDLTKAMKAKDELALSTIRMVKSAAGYARIEKGSDLTDDDLIVVLAKEAKQRRETIEAAKDGGRNDILDRETAELNIISRYLPAQLNEAEVEELVRQVIGDLGLHDLKDRGKVMSKVMPMLKGRADGRLAGSVVEKVLRG